MQEYKIKLPTYEGPIELLDELITKNKIDLFDIPIAEITEQYMAYLAKMREFNLEIASEFIVWAARLLQIKTRMMLPKPPKEEAEDEEDPRQELIDKILEYRRYKKVSEELAAMAVKQGKYYARPRWDIGIKHLPPDNLSLAELAEAFCALMEARPELSIPDALIAPEEYNIQDKMVDILKLLDRADGRLLFAEAFRSGTRSELVVTFLALLELIKFKAVAVTQQRNFAQIYISRRSEFADT